MNTKFLLLFFTVFCCFGVQADPIVSFRNGDERVDVVIPSEVSLSQGLVRGVTGVDDVSYRSFLEIKVFEEVLELKNFIRRNQGKRIDIYLYGEKVVSPVVNGKLERGAILIHLPKDDQIGRIAKILRKNLLLKDKK
ncbi:hypothetical protein HW115_17240 [Verrucomicrobiaceae bacterium N1E253]|uniref:Preprotein translocase subunit SecD n=1 Tax=Oceaniferula marina TaxID=2748318 RepID=A0A851GHW6_9BACT|nr:hypothetical protein [Oceaniferula marina]NWK57368.1 hypothetical protein [Oceaniferula marina]